MYPFILGILNFRFVLIKLFFNIEAYTARSLTHKLNCQKYGQVNYNVAILKRVREKFSSAGNGVTIRNSHFPGTILRQDISIRLNLL